MDDNIVNILVDAIKEFSSKWRIDNPKEGIVEDYCLIYGPALELYSESVRGVVDGGGRLQETEAMCDQIIEDSKLDNLVYYGLAGLIQKMLQQDLVLPRAFNKWAGVELFKDGGFRSETTRQGLLPKHNRRSHLICGCLFALNYALNIRPDGEPVGRGASGKMYVEKAMRKALGNKSGLSAETIIKAWYAHPTSTPELDINVWEDTHWPDEYRIFILASKLIKDFTEKVDT